MTSAAEAGTLRTALAMLNQMASTMTEKLAGLRISTATVMASLFASTTGSARSSATAMG